MCTLWRCKSAPPYTTSSARINCINCNGKGSSSWIRRHSENTQASTDPVPVTLDLLNPKSLASTQCWGLLCQVSSHSDQGFSLYTHIPRNPSMHIPRHTHVHTYTPTYTRHDSRHNIGAAVLYTIGIGVLLMNTVGVLQLLNFRRNIFV